MLTIYLVKNIADLFLCKSFGIKYSGQSVTFLLLVAQDGQNLRMEVTVTVARNAELKLFPLTITMPGAISVTLIARIFSQKLAAFSHHHTLEHDLH